jgi:hypothetical protein
MKRRKVGEREGGGRKPTLRLGGATEGSDPSGNGAGPATTIIATTTTTTTAASGEGGTKLRRGGGGETELALTPGWQQCLDVKTGTPYYWKPSTNETSWERPTRCAPSSFTAAPCRHSPPILPSPLIGGCAARAIETAPAPLRIPCVRTCTSHGTQLCFAVYVDRPLLKAKTLVTKARLTRGGRWMRSRPLGSQSLSRPQPIPGPQPTRVSSAPSLSRLSWCY